MLDTKYMYENCHRQTHSNKIPESLKNVIKTLQNMWILCAEATEFFHVNSQHKLKPVDKHYRKLNTAIGKTEHMRKNRDSGLKSPWQVKPRLASGFSTR
jgi:hypothetical protein